MKKKQLITYNSNSNNNNIMSIPLISIQDFSLNIGIEIEVCTTRQSEKNINEKNKLKYFININDSTINCNDGYNAREYIIKGYIKNKNLDTINNNLNKIIETTKTCKDHSCGLHFHISSDNIKLSIQGLFFLINFILNWNDNYQKEFEEKFLYKKYVKKSYSPPLLLLLSEKEELLKIKEISIEKIKNNKNNKNKKFLIEILYKIIFIITKVKKNIDNEIYNNLPNEYIRKYLTVVEDNEFIHIEFRDLLPWALKRTIKNFPALVKEKYLETIEETNKEIEEINKNLY